MADGIPTNTVVDISCLTAESQVIATNVEEGQKHSPESMTIEARMENGIIGVLGHGIDGRDFDKWVRVVQFVPPAGMTHFLIRVISLKNGRFEVHSDLNGTRVEEYLPPVSRW